MNKTLSGNIISIRWEPAQTHPLFFQSPRDHTQHIRMAELRRPKFTLNKPHASIYHQRTQARHESVSAIMISSTLRALTFLGAEKSDNMNLYLLST